MRVYTIAWSAHYFTNVRTDTRGRRSRRLRRAVRAARERDLDTAQRELTGLDLPPLAMLDLFDYMRVHRRWNRSGTAWAEVNPRGGPIVWAELVVPTHRRADGALVVGPPPDGRSVDEHLDELRGLDAAERAFLARHPELRGATRKEIRAAHFAENGDGRPR